MEKIKQTADVQLNKKGDMNESDVDKNTPL